MQELGAAEDRLREDASDADDESVVETSDEPVYYDGI